jgi:hypothetical protein
VIAVVQRIDFGPDAPRLNEWEGEPNRIEIEKPDNRISIEKRDDGWTVGSERYPANRQTVENMLSQLNGIGRLEVVSEGGSYQRYDLQAGSAIQVRVYQGDQVLRDLYVGKSSSVGRKAYARTAGREAVFLIGSGLRRAVNTNVADLREKTMLSAQREDIERVVLRSAEQDVVLQRDSSGGQSESDGGGEENSVEWSVRGTEADVGSDAIDALFRTLRRVDATSFDLSEPSGDPQGRVTVELAGGEAPELAVYTQTEQGNFPATISTAGYPFLLPPTTVSRLFLGIDGFPGAE